MARHDETIKATRFWGPNFQDRDIKRRADEITERLLYMNKGAMESIDILEVLEFKLDHFAPGYSLAIANAEEISAWKTQNEVYSDILAYTDHSMKIIYISDSLYEDAYNGDGWSRVLLAHELGHAVLHSDYSDRRSHFFFTYEPTVRSVNEARVRGIPLFRDSERQADIFAIFFLTPDNLIELCKDSVEISIKAAVDIRSASARMKYKINKNKDRIPILRIPTR